MNIAIEPLRIEKGELLLVAGFAERITFHNVASIPQLWQKLTPHIDRLRLFDPRTGQDDVDIFIPIEPSR